MTAIVDAGTDEACSGSPGPGGWGAVLRHPRATLHLWGGEGETTDNGMEHIAAIRALERLTRPTALRRRTDFRYVMDGITRWIHGWKRRGWKTAAKQPVRNEDLWRRLHAALAQREAEWIRVEGRSCEAGNELTDGLANGGVQEFGRPGASVEQETRAT